MSTKRIVVLMDANLICWMAGVSGASIPKKFDLEEEQKAFEKLRALRSAGKIELFIAERHLERFAKAHKNNEELLKSIGNYYDKTISLKKQITIQGSELDINESLLFDLLTESGEGQDDPELFLYTNLSDPSISHVASCDNGLKDKWQEYEKKLESSEDLTYYSGFRRRGTKVIVGLPSAILADIVARICQ